MATLPSFGWRGPGRSRRSRFVSSLRILFVGIAFSLPALGGLALGHYSTGIYIYDGTTQKDPMDFTFYQNGLWNLSHNHVIHHTSWSNGDGSTMRFWDHSAYRDMHSQTASGCFSCTRGHIRFREGLDADPTWGTYTVGAAHFEELRWCTFIWLHVAIDFDGQRNAIADAMYNQNPTDHPAPMNVYNNNTSPSPQCDGSQPRSFDGITKWIRIP